jgi:ribosomal protein S12 methylthiotransferase
MKYYLESLGCPKNLVDAQGMARLLERLGHQPVGTPRRAQAIIVNTCGFIEDARQESIAELRELARKKRPDQVLIAAGCLSQRWGEELAQAVPGLDALLGTRRWNEIGALLTELQAARAADHTGRSISWRGDPSLDTGWAEPRTAIQGASAYLQIADGCSAPCAFCAIPLIKGPARSRRPEAILRDAAELVRQGAKEVILIAQDTTAYGRDRGERDALPGLIRGILQAAPGLRWLRLMYAYPGHVSPRLIETMATEARVCHYLDLPLQHAHPDLLRRMRRPSDLDHTHDLLASLRAAMPDIALRTSFIVGYPGETEAEFEALVDYVAENRFDRVGVFLFSAEEGTAAADLPNRVPEEVQAERRQRLMALQQAISQELQQAQVGRTLEVLFEGRGEGLSVGRSYRDAPEIDGLVLVPGDIEPGQMAPVRITGAMEYDLLGEL